MVTETNIKQMERVVLGERGRRRLGRVNLSSRGVADGAGAARCHWAGVAVVAGTRAAVTAVQQGNRTRSISSSHLDNVGAETVGRPAAKLWDRLPETSHTITTSKSRVKTYY